MSTDPFSVQETRVLLHQDTYVYGVYPCHSFSFTSRSKGTQTHVVCVYLCRGFTRQSQGYTPYTCGIPSSKAPPLFCVVKHIVLHQHTCAYLPFATAAACGLGKKETFFLATKKELFWTMGRNPDLCFCCLHPSSAEERKGCTDGSHLPGHSIQRAAISAVR